MNWYGGAGGGGGAGSNAIGVHPRPLITQGGDGGDGRMSQTTVENSTVVVAVVELTTMRVPHIPPFTVRGQEEVVGSVVVEWGLQHGPIPGHSLYNSRIVMDRFTNGFGTEKEVVVHGIAWFHSAIATDHRLMVTLAGGYAIDRHKPTRTLDY